MDNGRFKIDLCPYSSFCRIGLYFWEKRWFGGGWKKIDIFETREHARALYDKIKDLPEYLP